MTRQEKLDQFEQLLRSATTAQLVIIDKALKLFPKVSALQIADDIEGLIEQYEGGR